MNNSYPYVALGAVVFLLFYYLWVGVIVERFFSDWSYFKASVLGCVVGMVAAIITSTLV